MAKLNRFAVLSNRPFAKANGRVGIVAKQVPMQTLACLSQGCPAPAGVMPHWPHDVMHSVLMTERDDVASWAGRSICPFAGWSRLSASKCMALELKPGTTLQTQRYPGCR